MPLEVRRALDERVTALLLEAFTALQGRTVGFYWPMKGEFDPRIAMHRLRETGSLTALPVVVQKAAPLEYREWRPGVETQPGVFGLPIPQGTQIVIPDAVLMPPVGFDAMGYRLGYGGGYFDRTLASITPQPLKIGVGRETSRIETIQPQPHDIAMDFVLTEKGVHEVTAAGLRHLEDPAEVAARASELLASRTKAR